MKIIGDVVCSIIECNGKFLLAQRPEGKSLALKWEFPGGKVKEMETEREALKREIKEELGVEIEVGDKMTSCLYHYPEFSINLIPYRCRITDGHPVPNDHAQIMWVDVDTAKEFDLSEADRPILEEYQSLLERIK